MNLPAVQEQQLQAPSFDVDSPCPCGSGLRLRRCCGLDLGRTERASGDGVYAERIAAMRHAYKARDREVARRIALEVLDEAPGQRDALGMLYNVLRDSGELNAAAVVIDRTAHLYVNDVAVRATAAHFFIARNDLPRAQLHSRMLVRLAPQSPTANATMGRVFMMGNNPKAAEHHFARALTLNDEGHAEASFSPFEAQGLMAAALRSQGRMDEARAIYRELHARQPNNVPILLEWATLEEADRKFAAAMALLDRAENIVPGSPPVALTRAKLQQRSKQHEQALETLDTMRQRLKLDESVGPALQRGQILDALGRYDEAFEVFAAFKKAVREAGQVYLADHARQFVDALRDFFTEGRSRLLPRAARRDDSPQPIFIIGFPRSGTTLMEQMLTLHPNIAAGDELPIINQLAARLPVLLGSPAAYPIALSELWLGDRIGHIETLRDLYLNEAARMGATDPAKKWFTDKMPLNETHLGLISLLFPASPVVHLVRHPLDVVLSVFSNSLTHGFNCASALETAAQHYALIADLIAHYRAVMPIHYHAVRYEDLVADQEAQVRGLFDFIGEPFDPRTLDFTSNPRYARTASYAQVTEKLYDRSRYRYRNYLKHLEPVIPILQPAIERLGYSIEE